MRSKTLPLIISFCLIAPVLMMGGCTKKSTDSPIDEDPGPFLMKEYFPIEEGAEWTWEVVNYEVQEVFVDGDSSLGEPFTDLNENGVRDFDEPFEDVNYNGRFDSQYDPWLPGTPYKDRNSNGQYDAPNGIWDLGEYFLDLDDNGFCNKAEKLTFNTSILTINQGDTVITRQGQFIGTYSDGTPGTLKGDTDAFSCDSLGLRWHGHQDRTNWEDIIAKGKSIIIARDTVEIGDSVLTEGDYWWSWASWLSVFEGVEDITVLAGEFKNCLRFKSIGVDWKYGMEKYNGVSYQWYAKGVGLVKSIGPEQNQYRILKSATVNGKNYP